MRRFRVPEGRVAVLPVDLLAAPGGANLRVEPGKAVDLDDERCQRFQRYLSGRVRAGDLVEEKYVAETAIAPDAAPVTAPVTELEIPTPKKKG